MFDIFSSLLSDSAILLFQQQQILTPSAFDSVTRAGGNLLIQTPLLLVAVIGFLASLLRFSRHRIVSLLTMFASVLLFLSGFGAPLSTFLLPYFYQPQPQMMPDGNMGLSIETLQNNLFYANLISSSAIAVAILLFLIAIFIGRARTVVVTPMVKTSDKVVH